jgi:hypothetical protein
MAKELVIAQEDLNDAWFQLNRMSVFSSLGTQCVDWQPVCAQAMKIDCCEYLMACIPEKVLTVLRAQSQTSAACLVHWSWVRPGWYPTPMAQRTRQSQYSALVEVEKSPFLVLKFLDTCSPEVSVCPHLFGSCAVGFDRSTTVRVVPEVTLGVIVWHLAQESYLARKRLQEPRFLEVRVVLC